MYLDASTQRTHTGVLDFICNRRKNVFACFETVNAQSVWEIITRPEVAVWVIGKRP
jgi:hypothetical protein